MIREEADNTGLAQQHSRLFLEKEVALMHAERPSTTSFIHTDEISSSSNVIDRNLTARTFKYWQRLCVVRASMDVIDKTQSDMLEAYKHHAVIIIQEFSNKIPFGLTADMLCKCRPFSQVNITSHKLWSSLWRRIHLEITHRFLPIWDKIVGENPQPPHGCSWDEFWDKSLLTLRSELYRTKKTRTPSNGSPHNSNQSNGDDEEDDAEADQPNSANAADNKRELSPNAPNGWYPLEWIAFVQHGPHSSCPHPLWLKNIVIYTRFRRKTVTDAVTLSNQKTPPQDINLTLEDSDHSACNDQPENFKERSEGEITDSNENCDHIERESETNQEHQEPVENIDGNAFVASDQQSMSSEVIQEPLFPSQSSRKRSGLEAELDGISSDSFATIILAELRTYELLVNHYDRVGHMEESAKIIPHVLELQAAIRQHRQRLSTRTSDAPKSCL